MWKKLSYSLFRMRSTTFSFTSRPKMTPAAMSATCL